jgi:hypothetical protein
MLNENLIQAFKDWASEYKTNSEMFVKLFEEAMIELGGKKWRKLSDRKTVDIIFQIRQQLFPVLVPEYMSKPAFSAKFATIRDTVYFGAKGSFIHVPTARLPLVLKKAKEFPGRTFVAKINRAAKADNFARQQSKNVAAQEVRRTAKFFPAKGKEQLRGDWITEIALGIKNFCEIKHIPLKEIIAKLVELQ